MTPTVDLEVIGARRAVKLTAIVDTGFDGDVCLTVGVAVALGLELVNRQRVELADGTQKDELVFAGKVRMLGRSHAVNMLLTASDDTLVGTRLLSRYALSIQFPRGELKVRSQPKSRTQGRRKSM